MTYAQWYYVQCLSAVIQFVKIPPYGATFTLYSIDHVRSLKLKEEKWELLL